jgi:hypothetical protein
MRQQSPPIWVKDLVHILLNKKAIAPFAILGALLVAPGCSDMPTSPFESPANNPSANQIALHGQTEWTVVQEMRKNGGTIQLDGQQLVCTFPAGALPVNQATITAKMRLNGPRGEATRIDIDFQPSMVFKKSISLKVNAAYLTGSGNKYTLWYFNPTTRTWTKESEQSFTGAAPTTFTLNHYSAYALTR